MMVRLSKEFGFEIDAFHHALEAWQGKSNRLIYNSSSRPSFKGK